MKEYSDGAPKHERRRLSRDQRRGYLLTDHADYTDADRRHALVAAGVMVVICAVATPTAIAAGWWAALAVAGLFVFSLVGFFRMLYLYRTYREQRRPDE